MTEPVSDVPPVLYRWLDLDQALRFFSTSEMRPTWKHLMPDTGRVQKGLCFGGDPWTWLQEDYAVCVAFASDPLLADGHSLTGIDGESVFDATWRWLNLRKKSADAEGGEARRAIKVEMDKLATSLATESRLPDYQASEWVLRGVLDRTHQRLIGAAFRSTAMQSGRLWRLSSALADEGIVSVATRATPMALRGENRRMLTGFHEAVTRKLDVEPALQM